MVLDRYRTIPREGSLKKTDIAYIAGFFDGDGSVRLQIQPRKSSKIGFRVRAVMSFAQKTDHSEDLDWFKEVLQIGYIYHRNDNMTEYKIEGFSQVLRILEMLVPYVRFKKYQTNLTIKALKILLGEKPDVYQVALIADKISDKNYVTTKRKYTAEYVRNQLLKYPRND